MNNRTVSGYVIRDTTIGVDFFLKNSKIKVTHHFLTHAHPLMDIPLCNGETWNNGIIYCTKTTQKLITNLLKCSEENIKVLEIGSTYQFELNNKFSFQVELIDAKHCPGSVMFLFNGYFGTILSTGDFRYDPAMFIDSPLTKFLKRENGNAIDICYLDNTYCSRQYEYIPTLDKAFLELIAYIELNLTFLKKFVLKYKKIGKEVLLIELAKKFKCKILVSEERLDRFINALDMSPEYFTSNYDESLFIEVQDSDERDDCIFNNFYSNDEICFINLTASFVNPKMVTRQQRSVTNTFSVPYTHHSSFSELLQFIEKIRPKTIVPTVTMMDTDKPRRAINNMRCFNKYLLKEPVTDGSSQFREILQTNFPDDYSILMKENNDETIKIEFEENFNFYSLNRILIKSEKNVELSELLCDLSIGHKLNESKALSVEDMPKKCNNSNENNKKDLEFIKGLFKNKDAKKDEDELDCFIKKLINL